MYFLAIQKMKYGAASFCDLDFLVPYVDGKKALVPWKFVVFFDSTKEAEAACKYVRSRLPSGSTDCDRLVWFHSVMSDRYCEQEAARFCSGEITGCFGTDAMGMVSLSPIMTEQALTGFFE